MLNRLKHIMDSQYLRRAKFGITIPGVSVDMIDPNNLQDSKLLKELEEKNEGFEIVGTKLLRRKLKDDAPFFVMYRHSNDMTAVSVM